MKCLEDKMVKNNMNYNEEEPKMDFGKIRRTRRIEGNMVSCSGRILDETQLLEYMGTIRKNYRIQPRNHLRCLNCCFITTMEQFHQENVETYENQKKKMNQLYFNQRTLWKKGMKPFEHLKEFNDEMEIFLKHLKEYHTQEFQDVIDECVNKERW